MSGGRRLNRSLCLCLLHFVLCSIALHIVCISNNLFRLASSLCCRYNIIPLQLLQQLVEGVPLNRFCRLQTCPTRARGCSDGAYLQPRQQKCVYNFLLFHAFLSFQFLFDCHAARRHTPEHQTRRRDGHAGNGKQNSQVVLSSCRRHRSGIICTSLFLCSLPIYYS